MMRSCIIILISLALASCVQKKEAAEINETTARALSAHTAKFYADTGFVKKQFSFRTLPDRLLKHEWIINGKPLRYGMPPVEIDPDPFRLDTLYFREEKHHDWDTILFNVKEAKSYFFAENPCCGGFDVFNDSGKPIRGSVVFQLGAKARVQYLGIFGNAGILLKPTPDTLSHHCGSVMFPNITPVSIQQIRTCMDSTSCEYLECLRKKGELTHGFYYKPISKKLHFSLMPVDDNPIHIVYHALENRVTIR
jgi:hypothetical protein